MGGGGVVGVMALLQAAAVCALSLAGTYRDD